MDLGITISVQPILRNDPRAPITPGTTRVLVVGTVVLLVEVVAAAASLAGAA
jgi:hypothetical protein